MLFENDFTMTKDFVLFIWAQLSYTFYRIATGEKYYNT